MNTVTYTPQSEVPDREQSSYANRLVGVWRLVTYSGEHENSDETQPFGPNPRGFLIYTADGFVSAQLMKPGRPAFHSSDWHHGTVPNENSVWSHGGCHPPIEAQSPGNFSDLISDPKSAE
jgi:Lipocalin-like domain